MKQFLLMAGSLYVLVISSHPQANAETTFSFGASRGDGTLPYAAVKLDEKWTSQLWTSSILIKGQVQHYNGWGDASAAAEWHSTFILTPFTQLELDAEYGFERGRTEAIKQTHSIDGDIGIEHKFSAVTAKVDFGLDTSLHENTTQAGFPSLDRSLEGYSEFEAALRLTSRQGALINPFLETAYIGRDYWINSGKEFGGVDVVLGATLSYNNLTGDIGVFLATRDGNGISSATAIGPQIDLEWTLHEGTKFSFAVGTEIGQETAGADDLFRTYSSRIALEEKISEQLSVTFALEALRENHALGHETEIKPQVKFDLQFDNGFGAYGSFDLAREKNEDEKATWGPGFDVGLTWTF